MRKDSLPTISVILPFRNEEKNLKRLLPSFQKQTYPKGKLDFIFIDDDSTDNSAFLVKEFGGKVVNVRTHNSTINKGLGLHKAKGEFIIWFDADMEIIPKNFFELMTNPLISNPYVSGSFPSFEIKQKIRKKINSITRFLSFDPIHRDPLFGFLVPSVESRVVEKRKDCWLCKYEVGKMTTSGMTMYRRKELLTTNVGKVSEFRDVESLDTMVRSGHNLYAFVPKAIVIHYHAMTLSDLLRKRRLNLTQDFLPHEKGKRFKWVNVENPYEFLRLLGWIIYANLFFPELVRGFIKMIRRRDVAALWQPVIAITTTDVILWEFIRDRRGRNFAYSVFKSFIKKINKRW